MDIKYGLKTAWSLIVHVFNSFTLAGQVIVLLGLPLLLCIAFGVFLAATFTKPEFRI